MQDGKSNDCTDCSAGCLSQTRPNSPVTEVHTFDLEAGEQSARPKWQNKLDFIACCISLSVGLGNIWRFPYMCYKHKGAVFLIPYLLILAFIGKPFYFLEMNLGQFTSKGSMKAISVIPLLKGVGWGQQIAIAVIATYYSSLVAITLLYFVKSFALELPWSKCPTNVTDCFDSSSYVQLHESSNSSRPSVDHFFSNLTQASDSLDGGLGSLVPGLVICLLVCWIIVYISMAKGIKTSGKVAYVFAILPYILLIIILIRALKLDGAFDGVKYFFIPGADVWEELLKPGLWFDATTQCFFSLTIGMGCIIMFSGYNDFDRNIYRDAMIVSTMDTFTSILSGLTTFAILGNLSFQTKQNINEIVKSPISLAFKTYPFSFSKMETNSESNYWPAIMAILFFFMLFTIGAGSVIGVLNNIATNLKDHFPKFKYWQLALVGAFGGFSVGLVFVSQSGLFMIDIIDHYVGELLVFFLAVVELIGVVWIYGIENFCWDVEFMLKRRVSTFWKVSWFVIMPVFLIGIAAYWTAIHEMPGYGPDNPYPTRFQVLGWTIFAIGIIQIVIASAQTLWSSSSEKSSWLKVITSRCPEWGPKDPKTRSEWMDFKQHKLRESRRLQELHNFSWAQRKIWFLLNKYP